MRGDKRISPLHGDTTDMSKYSRVVIYIPAYRCENTVISVLERLPPDLKNNCMSVLVVDNCSSDHTESVVLEFKKRYSVDNLHIIKLRQNIGYGGSQKIAYRFAIENLAEAVVMVHGDGQYAPELAGEIVEPILDGHYDFTFGSRIAGQPLKGGMPLHRFLGNRALTAFQNVFLNARLTEYHSGYRAFSVQKLSLLNFEMMSDDYHFDTEMIIQHLANNFKIKEVVIPTHYGDEENHVNIWKYGIDVVVTTLTYFFHKIGLRKSRNWERIIENTRVIERQDFIDNFLPACCLDGQPLGTNKLYLPRN